MLRELPDSGEGVVTPVSSPLRIGRGSSQGRTLPSILARAYARLKLPNQSQQCSWLDGMPAGQNLRHARLCDSKEARQLRLRSASKRLAQFT